MGAKAVGKTLGLILAGGQSRRFGSDKRLAELQGSSLIARVAVRAAPQVDWLALSAANDPARLLLPLIPDPVPGEGPLGGLLAGLRWASAHGFEFLASLPCDTPFFPSDLVARLHQALASGVDLAMARSGDRLHAAFLLMRVARRQPVEEAYLGGMRRLTALGTILRCAVADFPDETAGPGRDCFFNINRTDDLDAARSYLTGAEHAV